MKRVFKFVLVALAAAAVTVACQKPVEEQKPDEKPNENPNEEVKPVEGTSDWSVIGALLGSSWDKDYVMAASGDNFVLKNVKLAAADEFKIRFQKDWADNRGGKYAELGKGFDVAKDGDNIKPGLDGTYDVWYNPAVEQMAVVAKDGTPEWGEAKPQEYVHDYTPGAEYLAETNLWKAVEEAGAGFWTINKVPGADPEWPGNGAASVEGLYALTHQQSTYKMHYDLASAGDWERQLFLFPKDENAIPIVKGASYSFKMTVYADQKLDGMFFKLVSHQSDKDNKEGGSMLLGDERKQVAAGQPTVFEYKDVEASFDSDNLTFVIDFGKAPEGVNIYVKDIIVEKKGGEEPQPETSFTSPNWANVPAVTNGNHTFKFTKDAEYAYFYSERTREGRFDELWGAGKGYVYFALDVDGDPTNGETLNSNGPYDYIAFIYCFSGDKDNPEISINNAGDVKPSTYSLDKVIAQGTVDENGLKLEYRVPLADLPVLPEAFTITTWGNKDMSKVVYSVPAEVVDDWDYTPSAAYLAETNLWKAVDADEPTITFLYHPNWADPTEEPTAELKESTYTIKLKDADAGNAYSGQMIITPKNDFIIDPAKTYNFSCKIHSTTGTSVWIKMHQPGVNWPEVFETNGAEAPADRIAIAAGETKEIKVEGIKSMYESAVPQELLFDFAPHGADNVIHIKDIIVEEVVPETGSSVSEIIAAADETAIELKESLVVAKCVRGVIVTDGSKYIYAYGQNPLADVKVGDKVTMKGTKKTYNGVPEIDSPTDVVVKSSGNALPTIEAKDITATVASYAATEAEYISLTGTLAKSGNYYNLNLEGTTDKVGSIVYPSPELNADSYDGKKITITGFFNGLSGGGKYVNIVTTKIVEVAAAPEVNITLDGNLSDWEAVEGVEAGSFKEFKFASDAENIYMYFKIKRSKIIAAKTEPFVFNWRRYIAFGIDADNNAATGTDVTFAGMSIPGCEIAGNFYPFRGTASEASGTDNVEIVNGVEEQGGVTTEIGTSVPDGADKKVSAYGQVDEEFVYVEAGFARADVGSPAAGPIKIQLSLAWDLTDILEYSLK